MNIHEAVHEEEKESKREKWPGQLSLTLKRN